MAFQDIRKSRQFLTAADLAFILFAFLFIAVLLVVNIYLARTQAGGEWLFLRWSGVRAILFEHSDPYDLDLAKAVQELVYGREATANEYPYVLNDPFYVILLYAPLGLFSDFSVARGIWMLLSESALVGIVLLSLRLIEWEPPRWLLICLIGFGLFGASSVTSVLSASPAIFLTFIYLAIFSLLQEGADEIAGVLLCLVAYQWEIGALFLLYLTIILLLNRRWNVFAGFGMALVTLVLISFLVNSDWLVSYIRAVLIDWINGTNLNYTITLTGIFPGIAPSFGRWFLVALSGLFLYETIRSVFANFRQTIWVAFLVLAVNPMLGFAVFPSNHVALLPPMILIFALAWERWTNHRAIITVLLMGTIFVALHVMYFQSQNANTDLYIELFRLVPPMIVVLGLYWMRWRAVRPPPLWADQIGNHK